MIITPEIAECVGLWLAEGDTKTCREITFTNNCFPLVEFFANAVQQLFKNYNLNPRIYVYSAKKEKAKSLLNFRTNYYIDKRARRPYFIFRVGSVHATKQWRILVEKIKHTKKFYTDILRGFFAGEGNLKESTIYSQRTIRISQGKSNKFIERVLNHFGVTYHFSKGERAYVINGKWNWDKLAQIRLADLHPIKRDKFWRMYNSFKELHYPKYMLKNNVLKILHKPYTAVELSKRFERTPARIQDILIPLKKEGILQDFRVRSTSYWIKTDQKKIIISKIKEKYLTSLKRKEKTTTEFAKEMGVCWKSAHRRLVELQKLNLVNIDSQGVWARTYLKEKVIVL
jgi:hypothetical protein